MNKCYLKEFQHFDGEEFITFNIYFLDKENNKITVVITKVSDLIGSDSENRCNHSSDRFFLKIPKFLVKSYSILF